MPWPALDAPGQPSVPVGAYGSCVSAKTRNVDAAKGVREVAVGRPDRRSSWTSRSRYGFHIPARKSVAAKADKLKKPARRRRGQAGQRERPRADPLLWTPKCATAFSDGADPHRQGRRRPQGRDRHDEDRRSTPSSSASTADACRRDAAGLRADPTATPARHAGPQPLVLGLRRPVLARAAGLRLRPDPLEHCAQLLRRPQHRHPDRVRRAGQLRRHAVRPGVPLEPAHVRRVRRVHRADDVRPVARRWRCWSTAPALPGVLPVGVLPADRLLVRRRVAGLEDVDLLRGAVRAGQHGARLVRRRRRRRGCR